MSASLTYQWLGPGILVSAGLAFMIFHLHDRRQVSAFWLACAYFAATIGFTQLMLVRGDLSLASPLLIQTSLFSFHFFLVKGLYTLYGRPFPRLLFGIPAAIALVAVARSMAGDGLFAVRVTADYGFMAYVHILCGFLAWRSRSHRVDGFIAAILLFQGTMTAARIAQLYWPGTPPITPSTFGTFYLAVAMQTANALYGIVLGLMLFTRYFVATLTTLNRLADTDPLTGLLNRRAFETRARAATVAAAPLPSGLIVCDIDHFKRINDGLGHETGDRALIAFAGILEKVAGRGALCARLGGEEFCILLPGTDLGMTRLMAIRMRAAVEALDIEAPAGPVRLTASFGYREMEPGEDLWQALAAVDAAVYEAKEMGRNQVRPAARIPSEHPRPALFLDRGASRG